MDVKNGLGVSKLAYEGFRKSKKKSTNGQQLTLTEYFILKWNILLKLPGRLIEYSLLNLKWIRVRGIRSWVWVAGFWLFFSTGLRELAHIVASPTFFIIFLFSFPPSLSFGCTFSNPNLDLLPPFRSNFLPHNPSPPHPLLWFAGFKLKMDTR